MSVIKTICRHCKQIFIAEGEQEEGEWLYSDICYPCEQRLRIEVDNILKKRGH